MNAPEFEASGERLWNIAIAQHCTSIFNGFVIEGVEFRSLRMSLLHHPCGEAGIPQSLIEWLERIVTIPVHEAFHELRRLTQAAFGFTTVPVVIVLVDECQSWAKIPVKSGTLLSYAMSSLPVDVRVAVAGLADSRLQFLSENGTFYQSSDGVLNTLSTDSAFQMISHSSTNKDVINIIVALSKVPRILKLGMDVLEAYPKVASNTQLDLWRFQVDIYYKSTLSTFHLNDACWIIAATSAKWIVHLDSERVPGTTLSWRDLYSKGIVTRAQSGQYSLIFCNLWGKHEDWTPLRSRFTKLFGIDMAHAVLDIGNVLHTKGRKSSSSLIGDIWESMFNACLVLRYHLLQAKAREVENPLLLLLNLQLFLTYW